MTEAISMLDFWIAQEGAKHAARTPRERCHYWLESIRSAESECRGAINEGDFTHAKDMADVVEYLASELKLEAAQIVRRGDLDIEKYEVPF